MEGYFVRTLGMHRVYNSAFMHMLRDEDNAKYRLAIKNTLEFDPQILKRYVNFMNNPDEKTAVEQFGKGDKYFGICTLLSTLPGLPMIGHGQVEGYAEKYGMEFRRPKWDETPDDGLIRGHEWRIFPLLHRRYLFADVEQFLLYDFYRPNGSVDEEVFAYSNRFEDQRGLVIYHNKFADTRGWVKTSASYTDKSKGKLVSKNLAEGLGLPRNGYIIFKDYVSHLEYIRSCAELWDKGLYVELGAYQCHAFMDFQFVSGNEWKQVFESLNGDGIQSMHEKWNAMFSQVKAPEKPEKKSLKKRVVRKAASLKSKTLLKAPTTLKKKPVSKTGKPKSSVGKKASKKKVVKETSAIVSKTIKKPAVKKKSVVPKPKVKSVPAKKVVKKKTKPK